MFCKNCGNKLEENAVICTNCGTSVIDDTHNEPEQFTESSTSQQQKFSGNENIAQSYQNVVKEDKPNIAVNILSLCCIPILGIVMFFVWKDSQPRAAKSALIFSLINIGLAVIIYIILAVFGVFVNILNPTTYE